MEYQPNLVKIKLRKSSINLREIDNNLKTYNIGVELETLKDLATFNVR